METRILLLDRFGKLGKAREQYPHARIYMNKESDPPLVNTDILLLDPQEAHISIIRQIGYRDIRHQPGKEGQGEQQGSMDDIGAADYLSYF